ncbi:MAG: M55 family metallopeptidase [Acidobacteria bacterium]|nr:M55 family metallopeptidase [Acidobacteriota bacterium]
MRTKSLAIVIAILFAVTLQASPNHPKILIIYDMEGVSGVSHYQMTSFREKAEYARGREFLTTDVNAAIRGLAAGGAGSIWIQDGHGSGNSAEPDILLEKMDKRATFDFRDYDFDPYNTGLDGSIDAIICIGMHARANSDGYEAHTVTDRISYRINGVEFTETHIVALSAARWGIPVIMVSGDNVLGDQLKPDFPELQYAVVKTAKSRALAEPFSPEEASRRIEAAAKAGMEKFLAGSFRAYYLRPPFDFQLGFQNWQQADGAASRSGVMKDGELGVRYVSATFIEGYQISLDCLRRSSDSLQVLVRILQQDPQGEKYLKQLEETFWTRWLDPGKAPAWMQPGPRPAPKKRFHGDN